MNKEKKSSLLQKREDIQTTVKRDAFFFATKSNLTVYAVNDYTEKYFG